MVKEYVKSIKVTDVEYPNRLRNIPDRPQLLYVKGELPREEVLTVGIIGARNCSTYGKQIATEIGREMALHGVQVISGMARGIDGIGQRAALLHGGETYAVLGSGVDICYPKENYDIYNKASLQGGIISTYPLGTPPLARNFPPRNRVISGLADVVVVIEAGMKSGTMITVDMALEQGKDVYVVPGRISDRLSEGCNYLISEGAYIILSVDNFVEKILGVSRKNERELCREYKNEEKVIMKSLSGGALTIEEIWKQLQLNGFAKVKLDEVFGCLTKLLEKGAVRVQGGRYEKV